MDIEKIIAQVTEKVMMQLAGEELPAGAPAMDQVAGRLEHSPFCQCMRQPLFGGCGGQLSAGFRH